MSNCLGFWFVWHCWVLDILDRFHMIPPVFSNFKKSHWFIKNAKSWSYPFLKVPGFSTAADWQDRCLGPALCPMHQAQPREGPGQWIDVPWSKCCFIHHKALFGCQLLHKEFTRSDLIEQRCRTSSTRHWLEAQRFPLRTSTVTRFQKCTCTLQTSRDSWWFRRLWLFHTIYKFLYPGIFQAYPRYTYPILSLNSQLIPRSWNSCSSVASWKLCKFGKRALHPEHPLMTSSKGRHVVCFHGRIWYVDTRLSQYLDILSDTCI